MITQTIKPSDIARARGTLYQLLATVYARPPDRDFLQALAGWAGSLVGADELSRLPSEQMVRALSMLVGFLGEKSEEELGQALRVEFTKIFRGVKPHYSPPPPYESVYREESGQVFGDSTIEVHREYRRFGLDLCNVLQGEPPDHLSLELEFMAFLCTKEADCWERGDTSQASVFRDTQRGFLQEHLTKWVPELCAEVRRYTTTDFFRSLADLTEGWVCCDQEIIVGLQSQEANIFVEPGGSVLRD